MTRRLAYALALLGGCGGPPSPDGGGSVASGSVLVRIDVLPARECRGGKVWSRIDLPLPPGDVGMERDLIGGAVAVLDLDGDETREIVLAGPAGLTVARVTAAGVQEDARWFDRLPLSDVTSLAVVDLDDDGMCELLVTRWWKAPLVLASRGLPPLVDVTDESLSGGAGPFLGAALGDADGDGDLDLFLAGYGDLPEGDNYAAASGATGGPSAYWVRTEGRAWSDRSATLPEDVQSAFVFGAFWLDLDGDGRSDLATIHDFGWARPSQILWSRAGGLELDSRWTGWEKAFAGMGAAIGDLNHDGEPDVVQSSYRDASVLLSGESVWSEASHENGLGPAPTPPAQQQFGWGTALADVDRDGDLDVPMAFGRWDHWRGAEVQRDALFLQGNDGRFSDSGDGIGLTAAGVVESAGASRGLVVTDLEGDGALDIVVRRLRDGGAIYRSPCPQGAWARIRLVQPGMNRDAVGARVRVYGGGVVETGWVFAGTHSLFGSSPPEVDVGLGPLERIERLEVRWPDGKVSVARDLPVRSTIVVNRQ